MLLAGSTRYLGTQKAQALIIGFRPLPRREKRSYNQHLNPPHPIAYSRETIGKSMKILLSLVVNELPSIALLGSQRARIPVQRPPSPNTVPNGSRDSLLAQLPSRGASFPEMRF